MKRPDITIISILVAISLFIVLTFIQNSIINSEPTIEVLIANTDVKPDTELRPEWFDVTDVPLYLTLNNNTLNKIEDINGKYAKEMINKGQILFRQDIGSKEELKIITSPKGTEKIAIELKSSQNAIAYQIKPKDRIHLYFSGRYGVVKESISQFNLENILKSDNSMYTTCLLNDTEILGIYDETGRSIEDEKFSGINTIVIAVESEKAKMINNLRNQGTFDLTK